MQVKNISARLVTIADVVIVPGETKTLDDKYKSLVELSRNLEVVEDQPRRGRPAKSQDEEKAAE